MVCTVIVEMKDGTDLRPFGASPKGDDPTKWRWHGNSAARYGYSPALVVFRRSGLDEQGTFFNLLCSFYYVQILCVSQSYNCVSWGKASSLLSKANQGDDS